MSDWGVDTSELESLLHNPVLNSKLDNLHRSGRYLEAACPHCGGEDRFFSGPKYNYQIWSCRQCRRSYSTAQLLGRSSSTVLYPTRRQSRHSATVDPYPTVRPWQEEGPSPERVHALRTIYS